jgi:hypothetical protein
MSPTFVRGVTYLTHFNQPNTSLLPSKHHVETSHSRHHLHHSSPTIHEHNIGIIVTFLRAETLS